MNLVILFADDFIDNHRVQLQGRRLHHIQNVHRAVIGDVIAVGLVDGQIGKGTIIQLNHAAVTLNIELSQAPPPPLPLTLILALPRPKMLKRILQTATTMGVKKIILLNSYRVEKSYWQTPWLSSEKINDCLLLGLEQAKDTLMPEVILEKRFKPFVEDRLPALCANTTALVAHPHTDKPCPIGIKQQTTLVIGPEGGFIDYEIDKLQQAGCQPVHIGPRILTVDMAVPAILSRLFP